MPTPVPEGNVGPPLLPALFVAGGGAGLARRRSCRGRRRSQAEASVGPMPGAKPRAREGRAPRRDQALLAARPRGMRPRDGGPARRRTAGGDNCVMTVARQTKSQRHLNRTSHLTDGCQHGFHGDHSRKSLKQTPGTFTSGCTCFRELSQYHQ